MSETTLDQIAGDVLEARPFDPHATDPARTLEEAYQVQAALARTLAASGRGPVAGWKIAANNPVLQERFGISEPISAPIFAAQVCRSPADLDKAAYLEFAFEPEIAAVLKADVDATDRDAVASAIEVFLPAFELLDMRRIDMPSVRIADAVAQNISNAGIVLGGPGIAPQDLDVTGVRTVVKVDGTAKLDVTGAAPEHPIDSVTWLARHLAERGEKLQAGQVVLCGTHCPIWYIDAGEVVVEMSGLGSASMKL